MTKINFAITAAVCGVAILRGDRSLQAAAGVYVLAAIGSELLQDLNGAHKAQPYILAIDMAYTASLYAILVKTQTRWPKYAFVSMVLVVLTHLMANLDGGLGRWAFFSAYYVFSYAALGAIAAGAAFETCANTHKK